MELIHDLLLQLYTLNDGINFPMFFPDMAGEGVFGEVLVADEGTSKGTVQWGEILTHSGTSSKAIDISQVDKVSTPSLSV